MTSTLGFIQRRGRKQLRCTAKRELRSCAASTCARPPATATYAENFPKAKKIITDRLEEINPRKLRNSIGDIDLLLASPECTNHTCAKGAAPRSEKSRATALQALRFARAFKPRWVILENVVHMRPWSRYNELTEALKDIGYHLSEHILDASEFGVAQARRRLFIVCDLKKPVDPLTPSKRPPANTAHGERHS